MKNINLDSEDSPRAEYKRSDFGKIISGKYAETQVDFDQLTKVLLACLGEDLGVRFKHHSPGNYRANHKCGDWTYETDNANQVTLRYWLSEFGNIEEPISNPTVVVTSNDRTEFQHALFKGVTDLIEKVSAHKRQD